MIKRTSFLLTFFVANLIASSAYSVTVSKTYVDSSDRTLQKNIVKVLGMVNQKDASGNYISLDTKAQLAIPAINELKAALDAKANVDDVVTADSLTELNDAIAKLQTGKADASTVATIQETISKLGETYATDTELADAIAAIDLTVYAKKVDLAAKEDVSNKLATATAEQIKAMSSSDKESKYPSVAVAQTIADAAVTQVNEVAGDLSTLQTQVNTNTADIGELDETVADVRVVAYAAIPAPTEKCKAVSGSCALSSDTNGNLTWVMIANSLTDVQ